MTNDQIRSAIMGALSVSYMPLEVEAECLAFLEDAIRLMEQAKWYPAEKLPEMHKEEWNDFGENNAFLMSEEVLILTESGKKRIGVYTVEEGTGSWVIDDLPTADVKAWRYMPEPDPGRC